MSAMTPVKGDSWIRRWFSRQDDLTLWCCFVGWLIVLINGIALIVHLLAAVVR